MEMTLLEEAATKLAEQGFNPEENYAVSRIVLEAVAKRMKGSGLFVLPKSLEARESQRNRRFLGLAAEEVKHD